jgi:hypothetical protein
MELQIFVEIDELLSFVFPEHVQHPLTAGRLFCYSSYGPLDHLKKLRSGYKRMHILNDRELESMSLQFDRDDILSIYAADFQNLSSTEQSMIIGQSDPKFKSGKGKSILPTLTRADVIDILKVGSQVFYAVSQCETD